MKQVTKDNAVKGVVLAGLLVGAMPIQAAFINFDTHASTNLLGGIPPASAIVTDDYALQGVVFGRAGVSAGVAVVNNSNTFTPPNGACGLDASSSIVPFCATDIYFNFVDPNNGITPATTNSLSFVIGDSGGDIDQWLINVYSISDVLLEARSVTSSANITESFSYAQMARVQIQWTAPFNSGYLLDNLEFATPIAATAVPEPGSLALLSIGLFGLVSRLKRRFTTV